MMPTLEEIRKVLYEPTLCEETPRQVLQRVYDALTKVRVKCRLVERLESILEGHGENLLPSQRVALEDAIKELK